MAEIAAELADILRFRPKWWWDPPPILADKLQREQLAQMAISRLELERSVLESEIKHINKTIEIMKGMAK